MTTGVNDLLKAGVFPHAHPKTFSPKRKIGSKIAAFLRIVLPKSLFCWVSRASIQCQAVLRPRKWAYWTKLSDQIYLGAIPLKNWNHVEKISALGVNAILSIIEEHELKNQPFAKPVKTDDWEKRKMQVLKISSPDLEPVELKKMAQAVQFVLEQVQSGNQVYIHCTAGRGRSASVAVCTLAKLLGISPEQSIQLIKSKRPQLSLNKKQVEAIHQCYQLI